MLYDFFASTAKGMETLLESELRELGVSSCRTSSAGVAFQGTLEMAYRACLWSRIANRILLPLKTFPSANPEELYKGVRSIHWTDHMTVKNTLAVDFASSHSNIDHTHFGALKVKDAVVDQFRTLKGERPSVDPKTPDLRINVYVHDNQATVSIDLSGDSLHKRGYRLAGAAAPLKENLAAAIVKLSGWPREPEYSFMDPMCGSGTLVIEAATMASRMAPGLQRTHYGFMGWQGHVPQLWKRLLEDAKDSVIQDKKKLPRIVGFDQDFRAIRVALDNLERAGLRGRAHFEKRDLSLFEPVSEKGIVVTNPPYGERLGELEALKGLYKEFGDRLKQKFKGWEGYLFTGSPDLMKSVGLKAARKHPLYNGAIECRLLKYELY